MTRNAMINEMRAAGIVLVNVKKMNKADVEKKYAEYLREKEDATMTKTNVFMPETNRLPETIEKHTVYGMTSWSAPAAAPAPKKERKVIVASDSVIAAFEALAADLDLTTKSVRKGKGIIAKDGSRRVWEIYWKRRGYDLFIRDDLNTALAQLLQEHNIVADHHYNGTYYMKNWYAGMTEADVLTVLAAIA